MIYRSTKKTTTFVLSIIHWTYSLNNIKSHHQKKQQLHIYNLKTTKPRGNNSRGFMQERPPPFTAARRQRSNRIEGVDLDQMRKQPAQLVHPVLLVLAVSDRKRPRKREPDVEIGHGDEGVGRRVGEEGAGRGGFSDAAVARGGGGEEEEEKESS